MKPEEVTKQILEAWDEVQEEEEVGVPPAETPSPEEQSEGDDQGDEEEQDEEAAPDVEEDEGDEDDEEDEGDEAEQDEESVTAGYASDNPEVQAFLAKYQGDLDQALRGAVELSRVIGRQGSEKAALQERVGELERQLQQATAFQADGTFLNPEQAAWVEEAINSASPAMYIRRAVEEGEYDLARSVAQEWARENPFEAMRAAQAIDAIQSQQTQVAAEPERVDTAVLLDVLAENFPDMRAYEAQMVTTLNQLGPGHPLVLSAREGDIQTAARAIISIYEIARASTASVSSARDGLKRKHRKEADDAREAAVVSSASATPSGEQTPRQRMVMPGLSLEDFEAEFAEK